MPALQPVPNPGGVQAIATEVQRLQTLAACGLRVPAVVAVSKCRIPDDCIDKNRYPLFMARSVLRELIESLPSTRSL